MKNQHDEELKRYSANASADDVHKIGKDIDGMNRGAIRKIWGDVQAMWAMVRDPGAAWSSKAIAVGALVYLVSPLDVVPDIIPVVGLADDVSVILAAVGSLSYQLTKYRANQKTRVPTTVVEAEIIPQSSLAISTASSTQRTSIEERLSKLSDLHQRCVITAAEYEAKRQQILSEI